MKPLPAPQLVSATVARSSDGNWHLRAYRWDGTFVALDTPQLADIFALLEAFSGNHSAAGEEIQPNVDNG